MKYVLGYMGNHDYMDNIIKDYCKLPENEKIELIDINSMNDKDKIDATSFNGFIYDSSSHADESKNELITDILKSNPDLDIMPVIIPDKSNKNFDTLSAQYDELYFVQNTTGNHTIPFKIESEREAQLFVQTVLSTFSEKTIKNIEKVEQIQLKSKDAIFNTLKKIITTLEFKDMDTRDHSRRVSDYAKQLAIKMGLSQKEIDDIEIAGWVHDIGKLAINDEILKSKNGKLTNEQYKHIKIHPDMGAILLKSIIPGEKDIIDYAHYHHERYDGRGYPDEIAGEDIPLGARILCVADSFEAMTAKRSYNNPMTLKEAIEQVKSCAGTQFDPKVAEIFVELLEKDPKKLGITLDENGCIIPLKMIENRVPTKEEYEHEQLLNNNDSTKKKQDKDNNIIL